MKGIIPPFLYPILQRLKCWKQISLLTFFKLTTKINDQKVLFLSDSREELSGNLLFIYNQLNQHKGYKTVKRLKSSLLVKKTLKEKFQLIKDIATSKYLIVDDYYPVIYTLKLSKKQKLIQVWHACGAFKKVGFSRTGKIGGAPETSLTHRNYTNVTVSSENIRKNYAEAFGIDIEKIKALGVPRTDIFFDKKYIQNTKGRLYKKYPKLKNKKAIMFAPTFRGKGFKTAYYNFNWLGWNKLYSELKNDYVFIIKVHPFTRNLEDLVLPKDSEDFYIDLSEEREINDLLLISDILITDYSSVIFEFSLLNKPTIFFTPDLEEYIDKRDFYYPFSEYTFGPVVRNTKDLINAIKKEDLDEEKLNRFKNKFMSACTGNSTEKVVNELILNNE